MTIYRPTLRPKPLNGSFLKNENVLYIQLYDGLSFEPLFYHDRWLILCIESVSYCKSQDVTSIGYSHLRSILGDRLRNFFKVTFDLSPSSFERAKNAAIRRGLIRVEYKVVNGKKESRIVPNVPLIEREIETRKKESLTSRNTRLRLLDPDDCVTRVRRPPTDSIKISDSVKAVVTRAKDVITNN